jgi:hypothetical protein
MFVMPLDADDGFNDRRGKLSPQAKASHARSACSGYYGFASGRRTGFKIPNCFTRSWKSLSDHERLSCRSQSAFATISTGSLRSTKHRQRGLGNIGCHCAQRVGFLLQEDQLT